MGVRTLFDSAKRAEEVSAPEMDTDPVSEFYTNHPYPPPVANLDLAREGWQDERRRRAEYQRRGGQDALWDPMHHSRAVKDSP